MSLGISQHWRVLPRHNVVRGLSSIPRGFLVQVATQRCAFPISRPRPSLVARPTTANARLYSTIDSKAPATSLAPPGPSEPRGTTESSGPPKGAEASEWDAWPNPLPAAAGLVGRLADVPVRQPGKYDSILIPPLTNYPSFWEDKAYNAKWVKAISRQEYHRRHRIKFRRSLRSDWREILGLLTRHTPYYRPPILGDKVKIVFPDQTMRLFEAGRPQLESIITKCGCRMEIFDDPPHILVTGMKDAVSDAVDWVLRIENRVTVIALLGSGEEVVHYGAGPRSLALWKEFEWGPAGRLAEGVRADRFPYPARWTRESLEAYIKELTTTEMPRYMERDLYTETESHRHVVVEQLCRVLSSPSVAHALTLPAFKMALAYCCQESTTYTYAVRLLKKVEYYRLIELDSQAFNILLENAARARDLVEFQRRLWQMTQRGLQPTLRTWVLFLRLITSEEVRRHTLHAMDEKNLFVVPRAVPLIAAEMAEMDAYRAIQLGKGLQEFLDDQDRLYGTEWLTFHAANQILDVLGRYGRWDDMMQLLELMCESKSARPIEMTMNIAITHSTRQRRIRETIRLLALFEKKAGLAPSPLVYDVLFYLAWVRAKPQMLSVVWRYSLYSAPPRYAILSGANYLLRGHWKATTVFKPYRSPSQEANEGAPPLEPVLQEYADNLLLSDFWATARKEKSFPNPRETILGQVRRFYKDWRRHVEPVTPLSDMLEEANLLDREVLRKYKKEQHPLPKRGIRILFRRRKRWLVDQQPETELGEDVVWKVLGQGEQVVKQAEIKWPRGKKIWTSPGE